MNPDDLEWQPPSEAEMKLIKAKRERSDQISKLMSSYLLKGYKMLGSVCIKCDTILLQDRQGVNYCVACSELDSDTDKDDPVISESAAISMARELELAIAAGATSSISSHPISGATAASQASQVTNIVPTASHHTSRPSNTQTIKSEVIKDDFENSVDAMKEEPILSMSSIDVQSYTASINNNTGPSQQHLSDPHSCTSKRQSRDASRGDSGISTAVLQDVCSLEADTSGDQLNVASSDSIHVARLIEKIQWASLELQGTRSIEYSIHLCQLMKIAGEAIVALRNARV